MAVPTPDEHSWDVIAYIGGTIISIGMAVLGAFRWLSGMDSAIKIHTAKIARLEEDGQVLREMLSITAKEEDIRRLESKMDAGHSSMLGAILNMSGHAPRD